MAVLLAQLPVSHGLWVALPRLRFLQFPWRWLAALEAPMGILFALGVRAVWPGRKWLQRAAVAGLALYCVVASMALPYSFFQWCDDEDAVGGMLEAGKAQGFEGVDEYAPPGTDSQTQAMSLPGACLTEDLNRRLGEGPEGSAPEWDAAQGSCLATAEWTGGNPEHKWLTAELPRAGFLVLRLRSYPAWWFRLNGRPVTTAAAREDGLTVLAAPAGHVEITADWKATQDVMAGRWLSAAGLLGLIGLGWLERRLRQSGLS